MKDQLSIKKKSQGDDINWLLLERYINVQEEAATVESLVRALVDLGDVGQRVVFQMENSGLIHPVEREGSGAGGDVACGPYNGEREGGTSTQATRAPTPRTPDRISNPIAPGGPECPGFGSASALSREPPSQPTKVDENETLEEVVNRVQRSKSELQMSKSDVTTSGSNREPALRSASLPLPVTSSAGLTDDDDDSVNESLSSLSLEDNASQETVVCRDDPALEEEIKILNSQTFDLADRDEVGDAKSETATLRSCSVETDAPSASLDDSLVRSQEAPGNTTESGWIRESQQIKENQLRDITPNVTTTRETPPSGPSSEAQLPSPGDGDQDQAQMTRQPGGTTNIYNFITIKAPSAVQIGESNRANIQPSAAPRIEAEGGIDGPEDDLPAPTAEVQCPAQGPQLHPQQDEDQDSLRCAPQDLTAPAERPLPVGDSESACSLHPPPWDCQAHQTIPKQLISGQEEEEEGEEDEVEEGEEGRDPHDPQRDVLDVVDLRAGSGESIFGSGEVNDVNGTTEVEEEEGEGGEQQLQQQREQPPPTNGGIEETVMSRVIRAFVSFIDPLLD